MRVWGRRWWNIAKTERIDSVQYEWVHFGEYQPFPWLQRWLPPGHIGHSKCGCGGEWWGWPRCSNWQAGRLTDIEWALENGARQCLFTFAPVQPAISTPRRWALPFGTFGHSKRRMHCSLWALSVLADRTNDFMEWHCIKSCKQRTPPPLKVDAKSAREIWEQRYKRVECSCHSHTQFWTNHRSSSHSTFLKIILNSFQVPLQQSWNHDSNDKERVTKGKVSGYVKHRNLPPSLRLLLHTILMLQGHRTILNQMAKGNKLHKQLISTKWKQVVGDGPRKRWPRWERLVKLQPLPCPSWRNQAMIIVTPYSVPSDRPGGKQAVEASLFTRFALSTCSKQRQSAKRNKLLNQVFGEFTQFLTACQRKQLKKPSIAMPSTRERTVMAGNRNRNCLV